MFTHTLKISLRNLSKYKLQNLISIIALAVGIVTLTATHFIVKHMGVGEVWKCIHQSSRLYGEFFNELLIMWREESSVSTVTLSPITYILCSILLTALIIALIVGHHIRAVMKVNPAEMIAKE